MKARLVYGIRFYYESDYTKADVAIRNHLATGALLEVSENGVYDIEFCLMLCVWLRQVTPNCRLMLMCPEGQTEVVHRANEAKKIGEIAEFLIYDASLNYQIACLQT